MACNGLSLHMLQQIPSIEHVRQIRLLRKQNRVRRILQTTGNAASPRVVSSGVDTPVDFVTLVSDIGTELIDSANNGDDTAINQLASTISFEFGSSFANPSYMEVVSAGAQKTNSTEPT